MGMAHNFYCISIRRSFPVVMALLAVVALLPARSGVATTQSLFGRSAAFADTRCYNAPLITPDNRFVVFCADLETDGEYNLYRVATTGGTPVQLSGEVTA